VTRRYYQLVSGLPALPHFRRAGRLPLSQLRLEQRLGLLHPADASDLNRAAELVAWGRQPVSRTTEQIARLYADALTSTGSDTLRDVLQFRMHMRTVLVALRLRLHGRTPPDERWGVGPYVRTIETRWGETDFGLGAVFPWIDEARVHLEQGHAMELEGLLMDQSWRLLSDLSDRNPFGFEQVFGFVFKWDILRRWLSYDAEEARKRFETLILEVTRDHQQLFA
jgi:hypothetical protein